LMEMSGQLANFRQLDNDQKEMWGEAEQIDYTESKSLLVMRRSAYLRHAGDEIRSELILINTLTNSIEAGGSNTDDRVKMVIKPRPDTTTDKPAANN
jgi:lipopolysaccharide transport protein LptA